MRIRQTIFTNYTTKSGFFVATFYAWTLLIKQLRKTCMPGQGNLVGLEGTRSLLFYSTMCWLLRVVLKESAQIDFSVLLHFGYIFHGLILAYMLTSLKLIMIFFKLKVSNKTTKWLCFIKAISISRTIVTLLPKSYAELKTLLIDESNLAGNNPVAVTIVQKPIVPVVPKHQPVLMPTPDESLTSNENSNNSSLNNLDNDNSEIRMKSGSISR